MSEDNTDIFAFGNFSCASSANLSTPGPTAVKQSTSPQVGQAFGIFFVSPH